MKNELIKAAQTGNLPPIFAFLQKMETRKGITKLGKYGEKEIPVHSFHKPISKTILPQVITE